MQAIASAATLLSRDPDWLECDAPLADFDNDGDVDFWDFIAVYGT